MITIQNIDSKKDGFLDKLKNILCIIYIKHHFSISSVKVVFYNLRANAQNYREWCGHGQNLTFLFFECIARYLLLFKGFGVYFSKYGLVSGIFEKMDFALSLAKNWLKKLVKNIIAKRFWRQ